MGSHSSKIAADPQSRFNLDMFIGGGTWYEIARTHNAYEQRCENAIMTLSRVGDLVVFDLGCYAGGRKIFDGVGSLTVRDKKTPSKLYIDVDATLPTHRSGDFWVYKTDYVEYALVGTPTGFIWILSRTPTMTWCMYKDMLDQVRILKYDPNAIVADQGALVPCS